MTTLFSILVFYLLFEVLATLFPKQDDHIQTLKKCILLIYVFILFERWT